MNVNFKKQLLKIGLLFMVLTALVVGVALPAYADSPTADTPDFHIVQGKVIDIISNTSFKITTADEQQATITTNSDTLYVVVPSGKVQGALNSLKSPGNNEMKGKGALQQNQARMKGMKEIQLPADWRANLGWLRLLDNQGSYSDIAEGDRVIVRANSSDLAKQILIIKAPVNRTIKGTIALTDATHITITPAVGSPITLNVVSSTCIILHGQTSISGYAVAVYNSTNNNALTVNVHATAPDTD